ncbi:hypothetical protein PP175_29070 (plasmid) [Aneurinibacillus sp. Ricciae_BoGa-3]|uniref:hypothetical protein n=1 Tax=Aneurinibacillus sp. Ricciae_BoGa-3 TaxID=3022697 RepID=UPI0023415C9D|nr:hypothetical protein [Aneurinibacillus sp. Ricciae_BoGa-3]WCK57244.1 hypothetical protein PP175_29070 [Aneurinibacillus sp. Ricciae_BoGa-3]
MNVLQMIEESNRVLPDFLWEIKQVTEAKDENVPKYTDRNRIGKQVRCLLPLQEKMPLHLAYFDEVKTGVIQHSRIQKVIASPTSVKVYTENTMVELQLISNLD